MKYVPTFKHVLQLLGVLLLVLAALAGARFASANVHALSAAPPMAATTPALAPDEASVKFGIGNVVVLHQGQGRPFPAVTEVCTGADTVGAFYAFATREISVIQPDTCQSFSSNDGIVEARTAWQAQPA
jgi:hypothetical protein